jgi:hypothetical protein
MGRGKLCDYKGNIKHLQFCRTIPKCLGPIGPRQGGARSLRGGAESYGCYKNDEEKESTEKGVPFGSYFWGSLKILKMHHIFLT